MSNIEAAMQDFLQAKNALQNAIDHTPDERLNWTPSPTARTIIQIAAHSVNAFLVIPAQIDGTPFEIATPEEADAYFRSWERQFTTREQINKLIAESADWHLNWLSSLTPERLEGEWTLPFGMGRMSKASCLGIVAMHTRTHVAQIEYIQTIYGDHDWHMPS